MAPPRTCSILTVMHLLPQQQGTRTTDHRTGPASRPKLRNFAAFLHGRCAAQHPETLIQRLCGLGLCPSTGQTFEFRGTLIFAPAGIIIACKNFVHMARI